MDRSHRKLEVFISSTSEDLKPFREAARDVVHELGWHPTMMEYFGATPGRIVDVCRREVGKSDLTLLIVAYRRGWIPKAEQGGDGQTSITAYEFDAAESQNIPSLVFLA